MMIDAALQEWRAAVGVAWRDLVDARAPLDAIDLADASRYLAAIVEGGMAFVHAEPARPQWVPWTTPDRRWADNGRDSAYWMAPVDGGHRYRIHGVRHDECYLSFTVYAGTPGHPETVATNVNHLALGAAPGEPYELVLEPPEGACYVIARQYYLDPTRDVPATMRIEVLEGAPWDVPDERAVAARWRSATGFVRAMTRPPVAASQPSYASAVANVIGAPAGWRADEGGGRGTPDQTYALGRFTIDAHEALVMDVRLPRCVYASAVIWNRFSQSIDARAHRSTINQREAVVGADGVTRVVVCGQDPGVPNWLDTGGRRQGTVFWRFLLAEERPAPIATQVVPRAELRG